MKGISSLNCPECGADFRDVGITPSRVADRNIKWIALSIGLVTAAVAGVGLAYVVPGIM